VAGLGLALHWAPPDSNAQPAGKIPRIGILRLGSAPDPLVEAFRQGLRDLGHIEGQNVAIEYRWPRDEMNGFRASPLTSSASGWT
jgi:putative ABC transport system substrate-binding protein